MNQDRSGSQALLLVSTHCPHCHVMHELLQGHLDEGRLSRLDVVNIDESPDTAQSLGVRTVPWLQLNGFAFDGVLTPAEVGRWIDVTMGKDANTNYLEYLLLDGKLSSVITLLEQGGAELDDLLPLIVKEDVKINVRIGVGAVLEHFEGSSAIKRVMPGLAEMVDHANPTVRADVCHFLMLTHKPECLDLLQERLSDEDAQVREIARDSIAELQNEA